MMALNFGFLNSRSPLGRNYSVSLFQNGSVSRNRSIESPGTDDPKNNAVMQMILKLKLAICAEGRDQSLHRDTSRNCFNHL